MMGNRLPNAPPATIAEVLKRCSERAAPFDRRADRACAACGDEARERTERLWEGVAALEQRSA
jgi:hypothetical protein